MELGTLKICRKQQETAKTNEVNDLVTKLLTKIDETSFYILLKAVCE